MGSEDEKTGRRDGPRRDGEDVGEGMGRRGVKEGERWSLRERNGERS